ncbi:MAG: winged helix DNA-binding domain-containing protein, partial [Thermoplasmata archaeon]|nr:winged helix DNA-binding domain-containing protein [Thermoplasmata archaeon]
ESEGEVLPIRVLERAGSRPERWLVHREDADRLEENDPSAEGQPRTTLLSPFDNLISDRNRVERLFGFRFRLEIYVPPAQREFGFFVLPILHGDRFIGRVDPMMDRASGRLVVNAVHRERDAPRTRDVGEAVGSAVLDLARFLGASRVEYRSRPPVGWGPGLRSRAVSG